MNDLLDKYGTYLENRNASPNTITCYMRDVRMFAEYLGGEEALLSANSGTLSGYMAWMVEQGKTAASATRFLMSARSFYAYLLKEKAVDTNPAENVPLVEVERKPPEVLSVFEIRRLLALPMEKYDFDSELRNLGPRDCAILEVLYATGVRVSELAALNVDDVNLSDFNIRVRCSKKRERTIPIYLKARTALSDYILTVRPKIAALKEKALFVNRDGTRMSRQGLWRLLKRYSKEAGIEKEVSPHTMRHSFGVHLLENGMDLRTLQKLMGHSDISSTLIYENYISEKNLRDDYFDAHPRAKVADSHPTEGRNWRETVKIANGRNTI